MNKKNLFQLERTRSEDKLRAAVGNGAVKELLQFENLFYLKIFTSPRKRSAMTSFHQG